MSIDPKSPTLFDAARRRNADQGIRPHQPDTEPLAERMRPSTIDAYVGQAHLLGPGKPLARALAADRITSMILWGPPGVGKTTLGKLIAHYTKATFIPFSAALGTVQDIRAIVAAASERRSYRGERTVVFIDEIHRFNKAQQDAFLPHVESATFTLVGATTENPSFAINAALLSRCKVVRLEPLREEDVIHILQRALTDAHHGLGRAALGAHESALRTIARSCNGDARRALGMLDHAAAHAIAMGHTGITTETIEATEGHGTLVYDKSGEEHHNVASAFIKSMRGSDPDAAVYWMMRMLEAGDDPLFVLRRMLIFASEDIGNADPRALVIASSADATFRRVGMPEGLYALTHAALYLACAPKSNAVLKAIERAQHLVRRHGSLPVPLKLRNAVTEQSKRDGYAQGYRYPHDVRDGTPVKDVYLPESLAGEVIYEPTRHGEEERIRTRLEAMASQPPGPSNASGTPGS